MATSTSEQIRAESSIFSHLCVFMFTNLNERENQTLHAKCVFVCSAGTTLHIYSAHALKRFSRAPRGLISVITFLINPFVSVLHREKLSELYLNTKTEKNITARADPDSPSHRINDSETSLETLEYHQSQHNTIRTVRCKDVYITLRKLSHSSSCQSLVYCHPS